MIIEKATVKDIDELEKMYYDVTEHLENTINYPAWINGLYPTRATFEDAVRRGTMYVAREESGAAGDSADSPGCNCISGCSDCSERSGFESRITAGMVLKSEEEPEFDGVKWQVEADAAETYALCTLAVALDCGGRGIAEKMVRVALDLAQLNGKKAVRLDVTAINTPAIKLYEKLGFKYIGEIDEGEEYEKEYGERLFYLYEKLI